MASFAVLLAAPAAAATGGSYLHQATDPHGNVWLAGTADGTTTGAMDPGTDPASAGYGHLWTTDVPSGFCRILPSSTDPGPGAVTAAVLDRGTPGGFITAVGRTGGPALDSRRNLNGTFYVYTPDWAARSSGAFVPAAPPRLPRSTSPWPPGRRLNTHPEVPGRDALRLGPRVGNP